ncbi:C-type lectin domain family 2 member A-like isoform 2-T2 [Anomaloglossus baeobatrachus]|uniref:C-type lectin domain family 2 member A-like isoform X2 n=1 Tax=Anomaloglossus baeobatrachus TaxID=238106 RepID=UPI003F504051
MTKDKTGVYHSLPPGDTLLKIDSVDQRYCRCERLLIVGLILVIIGLTSALIIVRTRPSSCDLNNEEYEHNIDKSAPCEDDWMWHRGKCYYFSTESDTWNNSEKFCNSHGATLAIIDNKEELDFLLRFMGTDSHWIGIRRTDDNTGWTWANGTLYNESLFNITRLSVNSGEMEHVFLHQDGARSQEGTIGQHWICNKMKRYSDM